MSSAALSFPIFFSLLILVSFCSNRSNVERAEKLGEVQGLWLTQGFTFSDLPRLTSFFVQRENGHSFDC